MEAEKVYKLQAGVIKIRLQVLALQARREEVCRFINNTAAPQDPRHDCREPDMVLTLEEVKFWMRQHRYSFEAEESQVRVQKSLHIWKNLELYYTKGIC